MAIQITVEGADALISKLTKLQQFNRVRRRIGAEANFLRSKLKHYPKKTYSPNPLIKSDPKVRRGFFYHLKRGDIKVPYHRGYRLRNSWTIAQSTDGFTAWVGNNMPYAELVQSAEGQVTRHKWSGWLTDQGAINVYGPGIKQRIMAAVEKEVKDVG